MGKRYKILSVVAVFLVVMLIPSVALAAGPADAVYGLGMRIWRQVFKPSLLPYESYGNWGIVLSAVCSGLTIFGLWKLPENYKHAIGRVSGFMVLPIALMIMWMIIGMGIGLALGLIKGGIGAFWGAIPIINFFPKLVAFLARITWYVVGIILLWKVGMHLLSNGFGYIERFMQIVKDIIVGPMRGDVQTAHILLGIVMISAIINRRELNEALFYVPSIAGSVHGLYQFVTKTVMGQGMADKAGAKVRNRPLENGDWYCPNFGRLVLHDKSEWAKGNEVPLRNADGSPKVKEKHRCGFLNAAENATCGADNCDHPNPYAPWICPKCKYAGEARTITIQVEGSDKTKEKTIPPDGIPWDIRNCPKCSKLQPKRPQTTPFHYPWEDSFQAEEAIAEGKWQCKHKVPLRGPSGKMKRLIDDATGKPVKIDGKFQPILVVCKHWNDKDATKCEKCGKPNPDAPRKAATRLEVPRRPQRPIDGTFDFPLGRIELETDDRCECGNLLKSTDKGCRACGKPVTKSVSADSVPASSRKPKVAAARTKRRSLEDYDVLNDTF